MQLKNQFGKISQPLMIGFLLLITFLIAVGIWFSSKDKTTDEHAHADVITGPRDEKRDNDCLSQQEGDIQRAQHIDLPQHRRQRMRHIDKAARESGDAHRNADQGGKENRPQN